MAGSTPVTATKLTVLPEREPCTVGDAGGDCGALSARGDGDAGNGAGGGNTNGGGGRGEVLGGGVAAFVSLAAADQLALPFKATTEAVLGVPEP